MSENGHAKKSLPGEFLSLLEDQIELAALEWKYEKSQSVRRLLAFGIAVLLILTAFAFLQVAIVQVLQTAGLTLTQACFGLAGAYGGLAGLLIWKFGRRDPRVGEPFRATRRELHNNIQWIRQFFS